MKVILAVLGYLLFLLCALGSISFLAWWIAEGWQTNRYGRRRWRPGDADRALLIVAAVYGLLAYVIGAFWIGLPFLRVSWWPAMVASWWPAIVIAVKVIGGVLLLGLVALTLLGVGVALRNAGGRLCCALGRHSRDSRCVCKRCRRECHDWDGCRCRRCGAVRDAHHDWDGCRCRRCGAVRDAHHDWSGCRCRRCGAVRDAHHDWDVCVCRRCGKTREDKHDWDQCVCRHCGATRHQFVVSRSGDSGFSVDGRGSTWTEEKCIRCQKTRIEYQRYEALS